MIDRIKILEYSQSIACTNCKDFLECPLVQSKLNSFNKMRSRGFNNNTRLLENINNMIIIELLDVYKKNKQVKPDLQILADVTKFIKEQQGDF